MNGITTTQSIVNQLTQADLSSDEILKYLRHEAAIVRVNAIEAAARIAKYDESFIGIISMEATLPMNAVRLLGTTTVGHVAVACLLRLGTTQAKQAAMKLVRDWPANEQEDLVGYLKSEKLLINND